MTTHTATPATFQKVLAAAGPADTVAVACDPTVPLIAKGVLISGEGVRVVPADAAAQRMGGISLPGCAGVTLDGFEVGVDPRTRHCLSAVPLAGVRPSRIHFRNLRIPGDPSLDDGGKVIGVMLRDADDVSVIGCDFAAITQAVAHILCKGVVVAKNAIHDLRGDTDGIRGNSSDVLIENNRLWNFFQLGTLWHADPIQFWCDGLVEPARNITIRGNEFRQGDGIAPQGCFLGAHGDEPGYENVTIEDNLFAGLIWGGIQVHKIKGGRIARNVLIGFDNLFDARGRPVIPRVIVRDSTDVEVSDNIAPDFVNLNSTVTGSGNKTVPLTKAGDYSACDAWTMRYADARDVRIAELEAALRAEEADDAALEARAADAEAELASLQGQLKTTRAAADEAMAMLGEVRRVVGGP